MERTRRLRRTEPAVTYVKKRAASLSVPEAIQATPKRAVDHPSHASRLEKSNGETGGKTGQEGYFRSYSHFGIHEEMLKDEVRTRNYMLACLENKSQFKDKVVLDIGTGTGILSIFAVQAGARHVYGVDNASIADLVQCSSLTVQAQAIVNANGYADKITIIKGKMEDIVLPVDQVDIIISEWMGYFLLYESMLDTVLNARDRYLKPGGLLLPDRVSIHVAAIEDMQYQQSKFQFWDNACP